MCIALALLLSAVPRFESGPGVLLSSIEFHPVIFEGQVLLVEPRPATFDTFLKVRALSYLHGSGPDTVKIELGWINDGNAVTEIVCPITRTLQVPKPGDWGIYFLGRQADELGEIRAELETDGQIWEIKHDSLRAVGLSLDEGRRLIRQAAQEVSVAAQFPEAQSVIVGHIISRDVCDDTRPVETVCFRLRAEEVLKGPPIADTLTVIGPVRNAKLWGQGLYLLAGPDSLGRFRPVNPHGAYLQPIDETFVVGYRLESGQPVDNLVPITVEKEKLRTMK